MPKTFSLSKQELNDLTKIISLASMQEDILDAIGAKYKIILTTSVFKRLGIDIKLFPRCVVNINTGELIINDEKTTGSKDRDVQAKG